MYKNSQLLTNSRISPLLAIPVFFIWVIALVGLVGFFILGPSLLSQPRQSWRLGTDVPMQVLADPGGQLTVEEVAALPDTAFTVQRRPLNKGYTRDVYWVRLDSEAIPYPQDQRLWLEVMPTYLDRVTLYQPATPGPGPWLAHHSGDSVAMAQRVHVRQLVFPFVAGQRALLRLQTTSSMQMYAAISPATGLMAQLSGVEWASGAHQGVLLLLVLLIGGAALALRTRRLIAMAVLAVVGLVHGINVGGYGLLWLPESWGRWSDLWVCFGVFILPATFVWQGRELLTRGTSWRRIDRTLLVLMWIPLLAMASIPMGHFTEWAGLAVFIPWAGTTLCAVVAWCSLWRHGWSVVGVLMAVPYTLHSLLGLHVAAAYTGLVPASVEIEFLWQVEALLLFILTAVALGVDLVRRFQDSMTRQAQLVASLAQSEHDLDDRVRQRTAELLHTHNALQAALYSERAMRQDQRQFFNMVSHEFRTPLTVIDSAATEQLSFPTDDAQEQMARAAQIRRACRRLTTLVENCLVSERLEGTGFQLQLVPVQTAEILQDAAQLVHWSPRHRLALDMDNAPEQWTCDPTLVRIALSNLVDNAVKYAPAGEISVTASLTPQGSLQVSVVDAGAGLPPETLQRIFEKFERGNRSDETRGFGLGLWVARRVALLHDGDITVESLPNQGTRFTLHLPRLNPATAEASSQQVGMTNAG